IETTGVSPSVSILPADVLFTVNLDRRGFTVVNWGTITTAPKEVTITVTDLCGCEEISTTYTVYVYPNLDPIFNVSGLGSSGSSLTNFSGVSTEGMPGVIHSWELYTTTGPGGSPVTLVRGPYSNPGAGSVFSVDASTPLPVLVTGQYYLMTHRMRFENGVCSSQDSSRIVYISEKSLIDLGSPGQFTESEIQEIVKKHEADNLNPKNAVVFPNPTNGAITVEATSEWNTISIVDAGGKVLEMNSKAAKRQVFDVSAYPAGTYYFKIVSDSGTQLEQFIKQ
ncbi:T9SS type A sorting domain-containing protein, partial [Fluviicola sp.]|uniref:T9SS type A sorting domain-containing protein n=1 Tax=Fluviicola sp. TaxID=1917219 RepID=UPI00260ED9BA